MGVDALHRVMRAAWSTCFPLWPRALDLAAAPRLNAGMDDEAQFQLDLNAYHAAGTKDPLRLRRALDAGGRPGCHLGPYSFLTLAAMNGARECVEILLPVPDPRLGRERRGPAWWARNMGHPEIAALIESYFEAKRQRAELAASTQGERPGSAVVRRL